MSLFSLIFLASASAMTLEEAWSRAETESAEVQLTREARLQSDLTGARAWALLSPKLVLGAGYTVNQREVAFDPAALFPAELLDLASQFSEDPIEMGDPLVINKKQFFDGNLTVVQPLFNGQAAPLFMAARAQVRSGEAQEAASLAQLKVGVARIFWGAALADEAVKIREEGLELARQHAAIVDALLQSGMVTESARLQAQIAVARAERDLAGANAQAAVARQQLQSWTGGGEETLELPETRDIPVSSLDDALERARARPALTAAEEGARAAQLFRVATDASWLPYVQGQFTESWSQNTGFNGEEFNWILMVTASWTLWDGGVRIADEVEARSVSRSAEAALEMAEESVEIEVRAAWEELNRARLARASAEREVELARENARLAEVSLREGASTFVDAEDARTGLAAAQLAALSERSAEDIAALTLLAAIGEL